MALVKRRCEICGHETRQTVGCAVPDCATTPSQMHDHCGQETTGGLSGHGHGICTQVGCKATTEPLGLVNPAIG